MERRHFIGATALGAATLLGAGCAGSAPAGSGKKNFVLVHGAWHGAWSWERVAPRLRAAGHAVHTPVLAGVGERYGEISTAIDLDTHIADVVSLIRARDLRDVVLVGHSYGGFPVTGTVDRLASERRIDTVIYLDAFVPRQGERLFDWLDAQGQAAMEASRRAGDPRWPRLPARAFGISNPDDIAWVDARLTDHPNGSYLQPLRIASAPAAAARKRVYIAAQKPAMPVFDSTKARLRGDPAWTWREIAGGHDVMVDQAEEVARLFLDNL